MLEKIVICSDFLATREDEQLSNLPWLHDLLQRPLRLATGITPVTFRTAETPDALLRRSEFFGDSQIDYDPLSRQGYFDESQLKPASIRRLKSALGGGSTLVVGYELSPSTRAVLSRSKIRYIDIWLHPIRFLDDILFGFSSNHKKVFEALASYSLDEEHFYLYGTRQRIASYKGWKRSNANIDIPNNSAVFIGQTLEDKAVCDKGTMLNALSFQSELDDLTSRYSRVLFSRHPYIRFGDEDILDFIDSQPKIELTNHPAYHLIAHPHIEEVVTISSSVAYEAKFFGRNPGFSTNP